jgi:hypothetical protein
VKNSKTIWKRWLQDTLEASWQKEWSPNTCSWPKGKQSLALPLSPGTELTWLFVVGDHDRLQKCCLVGLVTESPWRWSNLGPILMTSPFLSFFSEKEMCKILTWMKKN